MSEYTDNLRKSMLELGNSNDYIELCINYARKLEKSHVPIIFDKIHFLVLTELKSSQLNDFLNNRAGYYREFELIINNRKREIHAPNNILKELQKWIQLYILKPLRVSDWATAYIPGTSIIKNAAIHIGQECVVNLDLKNFFNSISAVKVHRVFRVAGYTKELATLFTKICTVNNCLPQGAPTSPYLSNLVCIKLDQELADFCQSLGIRFTRYADDMTFSGGKEIVKVLPQIYKIISKQGFLINNDKTKILNCGQRQEVTGLVVNDKVSVKKEFIRKLSQEIHFCLRFGVSNHILRTGIRKSNYKDHLFGRAYFINMVDKSLGDDLLKKLQSIDWEY
ncbi:hypothetical protein Back11_44570 [Paenibacillus baekrokdamisoli]|uniref:RNA-directed DNA polymerase n=1 Tax=Paenibacillus baekrokdamisoli TaxID=1712516 RepID=A0A3G9IXQ0_9BACL|nr:reverse transcriptase family protein [Paenibacillus baekrokdamisoli]MBB3067845.1 RNA-directed DNA polymerase [Paenibacillus baekrokdamisoli]BBH23112.1 hypothetical protein Back11_44570 [Paenibacillus baekrokdamisoli]